MRLKSGILPFLTCLLALAALQGVQAQTEEAQPGITILADRSLTTPLTLIARAYATEYQTPVSTQFGPTNLQIREVEEGAEANVFIAAKSIWLRQLEVKGLIDVYSRTPVARNALVLAAPAGGTRQVTLAPGLTAAAFLKEDENPEELFIALGDPEYTAEGTYALDALSRLKLDGELEPYFQFFRDTRELTRALNTPTSFGLLFRTDAQLHPGLRMVDTFGEPAHTPIIYEAVTVAGENMAGGRHFVDYLTSDTARAIFTRYGFLPPL